MIRIPTFDGLATHEHDIFASTSIGDDRLQRVHRRIDLRHRHGTGFGADSLGFRIGQCAAPCGDVIDNAGELLRAAGAVGPADRAGRGRVHRDRARHVQLSARAAADRAHRGSVNIDREAVRHEVHGHRMPCAIREVVRADRVEVAGVAGVEELHQTGRAQAHGRAGRGVGVAQREQRLRLSGRRRTEPDGHVGLPLAGHSAHHIAAQVNVLCAGEELAHGLGRGRGGFKPVRALQPVAVGVHRHGRLVQCRVGAAPPGERVVVGDHIERSQRELGPFDVPVLAGVDVVAGTHIRAGFAVAAAECQPLLVEVHQQHVLVERESTFRVKVRVEVGVERRVGRVVLRLQHRDGAEVADLVNQCGQVGGVLVDGERLACTPVVHAEREEHDVGVLVGHPFLECAVLERPTGVRAGDAGVHDHIVGARYTAHRRGVQMVREQFRIGAVAARELHAVRDGVAGEQPVDTVGLCELFGERLPVVERLVAGLPCGDVRRQFDRLAHGDGVTGDGH